MIRSPPLAFAFAALAVAVIVLAPIACGSSSSHESQGASVEGGAGDARSDASLVDAAIDAGDDASEDAGLFATGAHLVTSPATFQGLTSDGYIVYSQPTDAGGQVAEVIGIDGGGETTIATGTAADKALRLAFSGPVVFVWTNRGNRVATLTVWSSATGAVLKGSGIRPGRGAASADGAFIGYVDAVDASTAELVVSPIAGSPVTVGTLNASDDDCWQNVDLGFSGAGPAFVTYFCSGASTTFTLQATTTAGTSPQVYSTSAPEESIGESVVVFVGDDAGALSAVSPAIAEDGGAAVAPVALASGVSSFEVSSDEATVVFQTSDDRIETTPASSAQPQLVVPAGQGAAIGPLSPDKGYLLFASAFGDAGAGASGVPTDVQVALADGGGTRALVTTTTSCAGCMNDNFTPDSTYALALDPIDDSAAAGGVGPLHVFPLDGGADYRIGSIVWTVLALGTGSGVDSRFLFVESTPSPSLSTGYAYNLYTRSLDPAGAPTIIAEGAEWVGLDEARTEAVFSIPGSGPLAGVWVAAVQ